MSTITHLSMDRCVPPVGDFALAIRPSTSFFPRRALELRTRLAARRDRRAGDTAHRPRKSARVRARGKRPAALLPPTTRWAEDERRARAKRVSDELARLATRVCRRPEALYFREALTTRPASGSAACRLRRRRRHHPPTCSAHANSRSKEARRAVGRAPTLCWWRWTLHAGLAVGLSACARGAGLEGGRRGAMVRVRRRVGTCHGRFVVVHTLLVLHCGALCCARRQPGLKPSARPCIAVASSSRRILSQLRGSCEQSISSMLLVLQRQAVPAFIFFLSRPPARPPWGHDACSWSAACCSRSWTAAQDIS